ncbi:MAG: cytochrome c family protein [Magnetococcales bacterium]|nr:cytochrome c family protein [Magnetococcales bacterium]
MGLGAGLFLSITAQAAQGQPPLHHTPSATCANCHQQIYDQWAGSMHANSTALNDPIHGAFYQMLMGSPHEEGLKAKNGKFPVCLQCHAPNAARDGKTKLDTMPAYAEGVNCVVCHTMTKAKGPIANAQLGAKAYEFSSDSLQGPSGSFSGSNLAVSPGSNGAMMVNPFPHQAQSELFRSSDLCLGCHDTRNNGKGVPVCATGPEVVKSGNTVTCQSCHMPMVDGVANHSMVGGHDPNMVKRGVVFALQGEKGKATVQLKNTLPHNLPTGAPFRNMTIRVTAFNAQGQPVWRNFKKNIFKEDPKSVMMLYLVGKDGKPAPPPKASQIAKDTRLKPGESRDIVYEIPVAGATRVRAELYYDLLPPPMKKKFDKMIPAPLKQSALVAFAEANL